MAALVSLLNKVASDKPIDDYFHFRFSFYFFSSLKKFYRKIRSKMVEGNYLRDITNINATVEA